MVNERLNSDVIKSVGAKTINEAGALQPGASG